MKPTCLKETQREIKISPNPSFPKRGNKRESFSKRRTVNPPLAKGGKGGFSGER